VDLRVFSFGIGRQIRQKAGPTLNPGFTRVKTPKPFSFDFGQTGLRVDLNWGGILPARGRRGMISIRIQNLTKAIRRDVALHQLDLEIAPGELFFLLGPERLRQDDAPALPGGVLHPRRGEGSFSGTRT
jgi:hypothetical protein